MNTFEFIDENLVSDDVTIKFAFTHGSNTNGVLLEEGGNKLVCHRATMLSLLSEVPLLDGADAKYPIKKEGSQLWGILLEKITKKYIWFSPSKSVNQILLHYSYSSGMI